MNERVFLLSPAFAGGRRASYLLREGADFELAKKLRGGEASIGEVYSFMSGLYFRGKMAYVAAFAAGSALVIVPGAGLVPPQTLTSVAQLRAISEVEVAEENPIFRNSLVEAAKALDQPACTYVLLGSVATGKYTTPLLEVFGERLLFPADFAGRGDMSRGGLMLRSASSEMELAYVPVKGSQVRGARPPKLA